MNKYRILLFSFCGCLMVMMVMVPEVRAGLGEVEEFFKGSSGFLVKSVGSGVFLIGLVSAGIKISAGDQGGLHNAIMVMVGGGIVFLAKPIVNLLMNWAGVR